MKITKIKTRLNEFRSPVVDNQYNYEKEAGIAG